MARVAKNVSVLPLAGGLRDRLGGRLIGDGQAVAMSGIEHNRVALESRKGSEKVTRTGPKTTCLELGKETFRNGEGGYVLIPANDRYYDLVNAASDLSVEFFLEIMELPTGGSDYRTVITCSSPYTLDRLGWEINLVSNVAFDGAVLQFAWGSGGSRFLKGVATRDFYPRTRYHLRFVIEPNATADDTVAVYVDNALEDTLTLFVGTSKPLDPVNAPIYIGGRGSYPTAVGAGTTNAAHIKIQDLRIWSKAQDSSDADVARYSSEVLNPVGHSDEADLVGWWPLDDGYNNIAEDRSRWGNHGYFGPSALVVRKGMKATPGAIFLDGHTSFLQADLRFKDLIQNEFIPNNQAVAGFRYGFSVRAAVLDGSVLGSGGNPIQFAELNGEDKNSQTVAAFGVNNSGQPIARHYNGSTRTITGTALIVPGQMKMWDFFLDNSNADQEFYLDGESQGSSSLVGGDAMELKRVRVGCLANRTADDQTPWSGFSDTVTCPLLVEEIRVWVAFVDSAGVLQRWEKPLTQEQIYESLGVETAAFAEDSVTVTADGSPDVGFIDSFVVTDERVQSLLEDVEKFEWQPKIHHIANVVGSAVTLSSKFRGKTVSNKRIRATRLGGYWTIEGPDELQLLSGVPDLRRWEEIESKTSPDARGDLVESSGSEVGLVRIATDKSAAEIGLDFGVVPLERNSPTSRIIPRWVSGIAADNISPGRRITAYDPAAGRTRSILMHHSSVYDVDDRWRAETPYQDDPSGKSLAFVVEGDRFEHPHTNFVDWGADSKTDFWRWRGWFRFDRLEGKTAILCKSEALDPDEINYLAYIENGRFKIRTVTGGNGSEYSSDDAPIELGKFHYLDLVKKNSAFELYIDGVLQSLTLAAIGSGFSAFGTGSGPQIIGDVAEALRGTYSPFLGSMTDIELQQQNSLPAEFPTASYLPPSVRVVAAASTLYLYDMADGEDVRIINREGGAAPDAELFSDPFVPVMESMGVADSNIVPAAHSFNDRFYASTGRGAPQVLDELGSRRMGIVAPSYPPDGKREYVKIWQTDSVPYRPGTVNDADLPRENFGATFQGNSRIRVPYAGDMALSGREDSSINNADAISFDSWIKPARLDRKQVLMARGHGEFAGNYAVVLIPNADGDALKIRFTWWDLGASAFKFMETSTYAIDDIDGWWYIWVFHTFGRTSNAHMRIKYVKETVTTGSALTDATLVFDGITTHAKPDMALADLLLGWSPIALADAGFEGFHGEIHEARLITDINNDGTQFSTPTGPSESPRHIMQKDMTDVAYEAAGAPLAGTNPGELNDAVFVYNINDGINYILTDGATPDVDATYEVLNELGAEIGIHRFKVTFYDPDSGVESNPSDDLVIEVATPSPSEVPVESWFTLTGIPLSGDRRANLHRRIYKTAANGGVFYLAETLADNSTASAVLNIGDSQLSLRQILSENNSAPPFFTVLGGDDSRLYIGRLDGPGFLYSQPFLPESIPATNLESLDSPEGSLVKAVGRLFGQMVFFLEDAAFVTQDVGSGFQTSVVATDGGGLFGGSIVAANRSLWRPAEQGIYAFAGVSDFYRGDPIGAPEGTWNDVDLSAPITGVYWRERDQAIWIVKRKGDTRSKTRIALDLTVGAGKDQPANVYTITDGQELACIGVVEGLDGIRQLWGADHIGMVYRLDVGTSEGPRAGFGSLRGMLGAGSTSSNLVTTATDLDTLAEGHRGEQVRVKSANGQVGVSRILSNTASEIALLDDLGFTPAETSTFEIGSFECFWRSGFLPYGEQYEVKSWAGLHINAEPDAQGLIQVIARVDLHADGIGEVNLGEYPLSTGHVLIDLAAQGVTRARLLQIEIRSWTQFTIYDYTLGNRPAGREGGKHSAI